MQHFTAYRLRFVGEVQTQIELNKHQGSAIRGALFNVLRRHFCFQQQYKSCRQCTQHAACPVSFLLATVDDQGRRGADLPRPYTIEPPLEANACYMPGERFEFGLTMFSRALNLFPYVVIAVHAMQQDGIGRKVEANGWRRGTFALQHIWAENPLTGERQQVMRSDDPLVNVPDVPITHQQVIELGVKGVGILETDHPAPNHLTPNDLTLTITFLSPTRLVDRGRLVHRPLFRPLMQRLFERLSALSRAYCDTPLELDFRGLLTRAEQIQLVDDETHWVEWESYSTRRRARMPLGGFVGQAVYSGDLRPFLPWLVWGQFTHVGKDAVKGNGMYWIG